MGLVKKFFKDVEKNIRTNVENVVGGVGAMVQGDFRNAPRTLLDLAMMGATGGIHNPDEAGKALRATGAKEQSTRTVNEQGQIDYDKQTAEIAAESERLKKAEENRAVASTIAGQSTLLGAARRRSLLTLNQGRNLLG